MLNTVLIVDDDPIHRSILERVVTRLGYNVRTAHGGEEALKLIASPAGQEIDIILLDLVMPELDGLGVLHRLASIGSRIPVITMVTSAAVDGVMGAISIGASDFVIKPVGSERLQVSLMNALRFRSLIAGVEAEYHLSSQRLTLDGLASGDPVFARIADHVAKTLKSDFPVLIEGEDGCGKAQLARAIHGSSRRSKKNFISIDCSLLKTTQSIHRLHASIERVKNGTLYLSSIDALDGVAQSVLTQSAMMIRPSSKTPRLIVSSKKSLIDLARSGAFREDLFYRLTVSPIRIPPLRERPFDLPILAEHIALRIASEQGKNIRGLTQGAVDVIVQKPWLGNYPEFEATIRLAVQRASTPWLSDIDFDGELTSHSGSSISHYRNDTLALFDSNGTLKPFSEIENEIFEMAQKHCGGSLGRAAKALGLGRSTLYRKFQEKHDINETYNRVMIGDAA
jgi:DNA-binding NtrC family response regulator